jgi:hypothetical protein
MVNPRRREHQQEAVEMLAKCPNNPKHTRFVTVAHEMHDWVVDEHGNFIEDLRCVDTSHGPDPDNIWTCQECGAQAVVTRNTE